MMVLHRGFGHGFRAFLAETDPIRDDSCHAGGRLGNRFRKAPGQKPATESRVIILAENVPNRVIFCQKRPESVTEPSARPRIAKCEAARLAGSGEGTEVCPSFLTAREQTSVPCSHPKPAPDLA